MAKYIHKPSGLVVEVGEGVSLPDFMYEPLKEQKAATEKAQATKRRKAAKATE